MKTYTKQDYIHTDELGNEYYTTPELDTVKMLIPVVLLAAFMPTIIVISLLITRSFYA